MIKKVLSKKNNIPDKDEYIQTLVYLKKRVQEAQLKAALSVNTELLKLYWDFGKIIVDRQENCGWGSKAVEKLADDMQKLFPGIEGFSSRNIFRMRAFYLAYKIVPQAVAELIENTPVFKIPWGHNAVLLEKLKDNDKRFWYAQKSIQYGWSRSELQDWIKSDVYSREGKAITNFKQTLPSPQSDLAQEVTKSPYNFDFLTLHKKHLERDLEQGLIDNVQKTLLEMGKGFALVGRQYHVAVSDVDYYIDLLFYHTRLKCYVVVELKAREFVPRDAGQINFYLSVVDNLVRDSEDKPTIGLLLCKSKDNFTAEYALQGISRPIGVAEYKTELISKLPKELKSSLPTIEEIEAEFEKNVMLDEKAENN